MTIVPIKQEDQDTNRILCEDSHLLAKEGRREALRRNILLYLDLRLKLKEMLRVRP
jgi:hypothetical protein